MPPTFETNICCFWKQPPVWIYFHKSKFCFTPNLDLQRTRPLNLKDQQWNKKLFKCESKRNAKIESKKKTNTNEKKTIPLRNIENKVQFVKVFALFQITNIKNTVEDKNYNEKYFRIRCLLIFRNICNSSCDNQKQKQTTIETLKLQKNRLIYFCELFFYIVIS